MPVIAVVNRKGGSGKSTIATHIAAYCAHKNIGVMLGDVDRQQSTRSWLKLREQHHPQANPILGWAVNQSAALRPPKGISHVVLDTPGGLYGLDLARVVMFADAIIMPICNSVFDRDSASQCWNELKILPRIATGRCKLAVVGMRIDNRTLDSAALMQWASERGVLYLGALRNAQNYVQCIEQGITLFDLPKETVSQDLAQWQPILDWLNPLLNPKPELASQPTTARRNNMGHEIMRNEQIASPQPVQQATPASSHQMPLAKHGGLFEALGIPHFLRRK